ncbi:SctD/MshK family protein [Falsirhodobacter halotolerans]|uniref:SctD/MshK family protein n=1 Tax=Falsirhodobacter halotolerans TaxID=1146892 RepID=UPI001FD5C63C|nr:FHA domain-containing protein [Falsirhodobacter halotolerans]MCJ8141076.1 hypothetical protein [Falsirhodobacter halotolerans]
MALLHLLPARPAPAARVVSVLDGAHRGAHAPVHGDVCTIGSGPQSDILLTDEGVVANHLRLRFHGRQMAVDALGGDVGIEGRVPVQRGHGTRVVMPAILTLGSTTIRVGRPVMAEGRRRGWLIGAAALFALAFGLTYTSHVTGVGQAQVQDRPAEPTVVPSAPVDTSAPDALRARIAEADLPLVVSATDHRLNVVGDLTDDRREVWQDIRRWFDRTYGATHVLTAEVVFRPVAAPPSFAFQAVWFGPDPYVVDARGERRYPGAALQDGWMLKSITPGRITVAQGSTEFHLTL